MTGGGVTGGGVTGGGVTGGGVTGGGVTGGGVTGGGVTGGGVTGGGVTGGVGGVGATGGGVGVTGGTGGGAGRITMRTVSRSESALALGVAASICAMPLDTALTPPVEETLARVGVNDRHETGAAWSTSPI